MKKNKKVTSKQTEFNSLKIAENKLLNLAKRFPVLMEHIVFFTGSENDIIDQLIVPEYIIGIKDGKQGFDTNFNMNNLMEIYWDTKCMIAVAKATKELGIQIVVSHPNLLQEKSQFIPLDKLLLDRPLSHYLPEASAKKLFPNLNSDEITSNQLVDLILNDKENRVASHNYFDSTNEEILYLKSAPLNVDILASPEILLPQKNFLISSLSKDNNKFYNGKFFGMLHIHIAPTPEIAKNELLAKESLKMDKKYYELISSGDAYQLLYSTTLLKEQTDGIIHSQPIFSGVLAIDPISLKIIGRSYFDFGEIASNAKDLNQFASLINDLVNGIINFEILDKCYKLTRKYSYPVPDYNIKFKH